MRRRGFTLIELLIVVTIIGILAGLLYTGITAATENALRHHCQNNMKQLAMAAINYANLNDSFLPPPGLAGQAGYTKNWCAGSTGAQGVVNEGVYADMKLVGDPEIFLCPVHKETWALERFTENAVYWVSLRDDQTHPSQGGSAGDRPRVLSSYMMNGHAWTDPPSSQPRRLTDFGPTHFLFVEESVTGSGTFDDCAISTSNPQITTRHQNGGYVSCMDGSVKHFTPAQMALTTRTWSSVQSEVNTWGGDLSDMDDLSEAGRKYPEWKGRRWVPDR